MEEIWKKVRDFPNYEISNMGRLRSLPRVSVDRRIKRKVRGRLLSVKNSKGWYLTIRLKNDRGVKSFRIHRLVYETFIGCIEKGYEIHHLDGNCQNNCVDNLRMVSKSEHTKLTMKDYPDMCNHMIYRNKFGGKEIGQYSLEGVLINIFPNAAFASRITGVCSRNICQVVNKTPYKEGKTRQTAGGYKWRYIE